MKLYELERQARRLALPKSQKAVFLCLISHSNRNGDGTSIFPGVATIALETSLCVRTVQYCLRELEVAGWIVAINRKGGQGRPALYHLNLDQFGWLEARPIDPLPPPERSLQQQINYACGMLKRLAADSPARPKWEEKLADLKQQLAGEDSPGSNDQAAHLPAIPETPVPRYLPVATNDQALVPMVPDGDLEQIEALYLGMITLQANEPEGSPKWLWWQQRIDQAREAYNRALDDRGIVASDGQQPVVDEEFQQQIQEWSQRVQTNQARRDSFKVGSSRWLKWDAITRQATETLNSLLYQQQGGYIT